MVLSNPQKHPAGLDTWLQDNLRRNLTPLAGGQDLDERLIEDLVHAALVGPSADSVRAAWRCGYLHHCAQAESAASRDGKPTHAAEVAAASILVDRIRRQDWASLSLR